MLDFIKNMRNVKAAKRILFWPEIQLLVWFSIIFIYTICPGSTDEVYKDIKFLLFYEEKKFLKIMFQSLHFYLIQISYTLCQVSTIDQLFNQTTLRNFCLQYIQNICITFCTTIVLKLHSAIKQVYCTYINSTGADWPK